ncbi:MAG TPA: chromate transporter [Polyangiales bacterium]|nr:chromate transporter [Polyangiales bacterium]
MSNRAELHGVPAVHPEPIVACPPADRASTKRLSFCSFTFTTATFIGYVLAGPYGALVATAGIFLPAFVFVALSGPFVPRLRASRRASAFLDGVNVASLALMIVVTLQLARTALVDVPSVLIGVCATGLLLRYKVGSTWLVLGGALLGMIVHVLELAL